MMVVKAIFPPCQSFIFDSSINAGESVPNVLPGSQSITKQLNTKTNGMIVKYAKETSIFVLS